VGKAERKRCFFEKKQQKTFDPSGAKRAARPKPSAIKSLLRRFSSEQQPVS
jgi:hypothetical protein